MSVAAVAADTPTPLIELGIVLLLLGVAGRLARRVGVPPVPLYVLAGLALGEGGVLEVFTARDFVETGAQIGVILLLLMLGLEYSGAELIANLRTSRRAGVLDLVLNATPGVVVGHLLGRGTVAAVFLGGITYISSSGIVAKLLDDLERIGNRETPTILSILIFEDLVMAVFLPIAAGLAIASGVTDTVVDIAIAIGAVAVAFAITLRFGDRLSRFIFHSSNELLVLTILGAALLVAGSAERLQAPAAVAALLVGIALSGPAASGARHVLTPLRDVFAAVFFVFFGLEIDPASLLPVLPEAAALALVTATTKVLTGAWAAGQGGWPSPGASGRAWPWWPAGSSRSSSRTGAGPRPRTRARVLRHRLRPDRRLRRPRARSLLRSNGRAVRATGSQGFPRTPTTPRTGPTHGHVGPSSRSFPEPAPRCRSSWALRRLRPIGHVAAQEHRSLLRAGRAGNLSRWTEGVAVPASPRAPGAISTDRALSFFTHGCLHP